MKATEFLKGFDACVGHAWDLTDACQDGYDNPSKANPFIYSSPNSNAFEAGQEWKKTGKPRPTKCASGRGQLVKVDGVEYRAK